MKVNLTLIVFCSLFANSIYATPSLTNVDTDGDGLVEINTVDDFAALRDTWEKGLVDLNGNNTGCPDDGCNGYELMADLDLANLSDAGDLPYPFLVGIVFEGNGYTLNNVTPQLAQRGLFRQLSGTTIQNLNLENVDFRASTDYLGSISPQVVDSKLINVTVSGHLQSDHYTGGLLGVAANTLVVNSHFTGTINTIHPYTIGAGGLVGRADDVTLFASSATVSFTPMTDPAFARIGALFGVQGGRNFILASTAEVTNLLKPILTSEYNGTFGLIVEDSYVVLRAVESMPTSGKVFRWFQDFPDTSSSNVTEDLSLDDMSCPNSENATLCSYPTLYKGWLKHKDDNNQNVWDLSIDGTSPSINPSLTFGLADDDADGFLNSLDAFPLNPAAFLDHDGDGKPEAWNVACDIDCQEQSGLSLDEEVESFFTDVDSEQNPDGLGGAFHLFDLLLGLILLPLALRLRKSIKQCA